MLAKTPPMGWNSWNTFGGNINEKVVRETADKFIELGYKDAGYEYVVIDDCWSLFNRDENHRLVADPEKFPSGMKALADYVHSKGLKFGMYSCAGDRTCAGYPGSFEHEFIDAETFAGWGIDLLKYDYCFKPSDMPGIISYKRMAMALRATGRDIILSGCNWGGDNCKQWMRAVGAQMWRSTGDINDSWQSIKDIFTSQMNESCYSAPGSWNDMDMLVVGMNGSGNVALGGCSYEEYKTHFTMWALFNSPLMIGCDITKIDDSMKAILQNKDVIAINQDEEGRQPFLATMYDSKKLCFVRPISNNEYAIGMFNIGDEPNDTVLHFFEIGLPASSGYGLELYDCWEHKVIGTFDGRTSYHTMLDTHACALYKAKIVKL